LRCRRAARAADFELLTALQQTVPTKPFDKLRTGQAQGERKSAKFVEVLWESKSKPFLETKIAKNRIQQAQPAIKNIAN
jgi:hypothetical protein